MLKNWFKIYVYNSKKNKVYFLLTLLCLAIGITAVLLSTLYFKEEYSFDQWNENKETIYFVESGGGKVILSGHPIPLAGKLKEEYQWIDDYLLYGQYQSLVVEHQTKEYRLDKILATNQSFFDFFPYTLVYGTKEGLFQHPNELVLEKKQSDLLFGQGVNPIGKQVKIDEDFFTVVGVYSLENKKSSFMPEAVVNTYQFLSAEQQAAWRQPKVGILVKTKHPSETIQAIEELYKTYYFTPWAAESNMKVDDFITQMKGIIALDTKLHHLPEIHFQREASITGNILEPKANVKMVYIIVGLSSLMFLLSLFNYVNLALCQILYRAKEVGVRKVLGGVKWTIIKQSLMETSWTICLAFGLSVFFFLGVRPFANAYLKVDISVQFTAFVFLFVGVYVLILLLAGLIPALYIAQYRVLRVLKGDFSRSRSGSWIKNSFLIVQFAIACWFSVGSYVVYQQAAYMTKKELGFNGSQVLAFHFLPEVYDKTKVQQYETFKKEALKIKGIEQVAVSGLGFGNNNSMSSISIFAYKENPQIMAMNIKAEASYFGMMEMELKEGRWLDTNLANDSIQNILINEKLLQELGETSVEGLKLNDKIVVGVIKDFHTNGLENTISPMMFMLPNGEDTYFYEVTMKVDVEQLDTFLPALEKLWLTFNPETKAPFSYQFIDKQFAETFEKIQQQKRVLFYLNYIVIFIALFGLFAVSSFTIGTKLKEIAIRKVLGASREGLIGKLSYQYLIYCFIGFGLSIFPSYYLLNKWLEDYAYRIEIGYEVYVVCFVLIVLLTLIIVVSRAYKATKVNVLEYIKYE
ncbi:ABC transporter permease [Myroides sp. WP-1]|uniref:ABC transporter permease n=1 Tax=Myroides sp. WP-1 TaxID=2759944 RepID=UPI0015FD7B23|nr:FtsX-like permease family protein [Myroides sp. WP-1]MBB1138836.1 ABC transporter permease [Myroides sp. WP-1]